MDRPHHSVWLGRQNANMSLVISPSFTFRVDVQRVQIQAKNAKGLLSSSANHTGGCEPSGKASFRKMMSEARRSGSRPQASAASGRGHVPDVDDARIALAALEGEHRRRHAPAGCRKLAHAVRRVADDRGGIVGEYAGEERQVAGDVAHGPREFEDRLLAFDEGVEVAHVKDLRSDRPVAKLGDPDIRKRLEFAVGKLFEVGA